MSVRAEDDNEACLVVHNVARDIDVNTAMNFAAHNTGETVSADVGVAPAQAEQLAVQNGRLYMARGTDSVEDWVQVGNGGEVEMLPENESAPTVRGMRMVATANTRSTRIDEFRDGVNGQMLTVLVLDNETEFRNDRGNAGFRLRKGDNWSPDAGDTLTLVNHQGMWFELGRSDNT